MGLNLGWFIGVEADKKNDTIEAIKHSTVVLRQLKLFLENEMKALDRVPLEDYETPAWPYKEADRLGQLRALRKVCALLP